MSSEGETHVSLLGPEDGFQVEFSIPERGTECQG